MSDFLPHQEDSLARLAQAALDRVVRESTGSGAEPTAFHRAESADMAPASYQRMNVDLMDEASHRSLQYFRQRYTDSSTERSDASDLHGAMTHSMPYYLADAQSTGRANSALTGTGGQFSGGNAPGGTRSAPASASGFDGQLVRRDFPILTEIVHGKQLVWLDNAATTQKPSVVIDRLTQFYLHENSNVHRAAHELARRSTDAYESARATVAQFLNAGSAEEIVFVRGTTEGINLIAQSWGRRRIRAGDAIVISHLEHHANIVPWQLLCDEKNARLLVAPVDDNGQIILSALDAMLDESVKLVSVSHVSNALGTITPVDAIVQMAHRRGIPVLLDAAQSVSHMPVDVRGLDCDFCVFSGHKVFGPTGIGAIFAKGSILDEMPPWQGGGNMIENVTFNGTTFQKAPMRFEAGTGNIADAVGLATALEYIRHWGLPNIARYEHDLLHYATEKLNRINGMRMIGTAAEKAGVLSFVVPGVDSMDIGKLLSYEGIAVRVGHHCAQPILRRFGLENTIRASLALYNTSSEIDFFTDTVQRAVTRLRGNHSTRWS